MSAPRPTYTDAFRGQILALYRSGRTPRELPDEFQPTEWTIRNWIRKAEADPASSLDSPEPKELDRLPK